MKTFIRFSLSLFALGIVIFFVGYFLGPASLHNPGGEHPTGQLGADHTIETGRQPAQQK
jgi:hypothetical protein